MMRISGLISLLAAVFILTACDASTPSQMQTGKMRVREDMVVETLDASRVDAARVNTIADRFIRNGRGRMTLTVSHAPGKNEEKTAGKYGDVYKKAFEKRGVSGVSVVTVAMADRQHADKMVVAYKAVVAAAAPDCGRIPGHSGGDSLTGAAQYKYGCEIQANLGKMIADPSDLLGKAGTQDNDSRRSGTIIETYKAGTPNQKMQGYQASTVGN